jgi:uncharacterized Zn-finger protein
VRSPGQRMKSQVKTGRETMSEPTVEVLCKNCGQTFTAFLKEMAAKNAEVTCPYCGKSAGNPPQNSAMPPAVRN